MTLNGQGDKADTILHSEENNTRYIGYCTGINRVVHLLHYIECNIEYKIKVSKEIPVNVHHELYPVLNLALDLALNLARISCTVSIYDRSIPYTMVGVRAWIN